jgi:NAD(P)-dependent dehydrogenase (short-subunit alcohol dehydrogenase family)
VSDEGGEQAHRGSVDRSAVPTGLKQHELDGAERLARRGHRVVFIPATGKGKIADLMLNDELWELKSISGSSNDAVARNIRRAAKQAQRVVLDMTDSPITDEAVKRLVEHYARRYRIQSVRAIRGFNGLDWTFDNDE